MRIQYSTYLKLRNALKEHCKGILKDNALDNAIFKHFLIKYNRVVFENRKRLLVAFRLPYWYSESVYKSIRKAFKKFINR